MTDAPATITAKTATSLATTGNAIVFECAIPATPGFTGSYANTPAVATPGVTLSSTATDVHTSY